MQAHIYIQHHVPNTAAGGEAAVGGQAAADAKVSHPHVAQAGVGPIIKLAEQGVVGLEVQMDPACSVHGCCAGRHGMSHCHHAVQAIQRVAAGWSPEVTMGVCMYVYMYMYGRVCVLCICVSVYMYGCMCI